MSTLPQINFKIETLEKMMDAPPLEQGEADFVVEDSDITFADVRFAYGREEVLHEVNLSMASGTLTALVGESGSGKSTLAKLLIHFYDLTGGSIRIGG